MRCFIVVLIILVLASPCDAGSRPNKPARGISPAMAAGVAGGRYGVEIPVPDERLGWSTKGIQPSGDGNGYGSILATFYPHLEATDVIIALTHFTAESANPILAEGGVYWAVRRAPKEADRLATAWAVLEPATFQLLIVAPASACGQKVYVTSHDGWKFFNLTGECGSDGQFVLEPDGKHIRIVKAGTPEHRKLLERIRRILSASYDAVEPIADKLDVDPDREPGIHGFLRVLFDLIRIVSSVSIIDGNLDPSGRSWDWGRSFRAAAEVTYRYEDFAWRTKVPSAEGTRGDKGTSRWDVAGQIQLSRKVEKTYSELESRGARADSGWCLDFVLGTSMPEVQTPRIVPQTTPEPTAQPPAHSIGGAQVGYTTGNGRGETLSARSQKVSPRPTEETPDSGKKPRRVRAVSFYAPPGWRDKHLPVRDEINAAEREAEQVTRDAEADTQKAKP